LSFSVRKVQRVSTIGGGYTRNNPSGVHRPDLQGEIDRLIVSAVAPNTSKVYQQALRSFKEFRTLFQFEDLWPIPLHDITNYIAYMSFTGTAASTVKSYISGLSFFSKINNYTDCFNTFVVRKLLEGMKRSQNRPKDVRLPITLDLLLKINNVLPAVCHNDYETKPFQASFSLAFFGFLRVGELTADHKHASTQSHAIEYNDIKINLSSIEIRLRSSKTDQCCTGTTIVIDVRPGDVCAVFALRNYLKVRPNVAGQLFCHFDGTPVTRYQFSGVLKKSLNVLGLSQGKYSSHSFRIGAATSAAMNGLSDSEIQAMGRWKSDAFRSYIRIQQCL
ncbi:integrase/recombinase xerD homolog, partial [Mytilus galloprovincialis]|uniref:integrase/recombinase xerD homolog n=1 Tax=Mytilus galloprovincialis TaxID=29158 RepID=UPI003F7B8DD3